MNNGHKMNEMCKYVLFRPKVSKIDEPKQH